MTDQGKNADARHAEGHRQFCKLHVTLFIKNPAGMQQVNGATEDFRIFDSPPR
jgi:hypothetical protein